MATQKSECPVCASFINSSVITEHVNSCLNKQQTTQTHQNEDVYDDNLMKENNDDNDTNHSGSIVTGICHDNYNDNETSNNRPFTFKRKSNEWSFFKRQCSTSVSANKNELQTSKNKPINNKKAKLVKSKVIKSEKSESTQLLNGKSIQVSQGFNRNSVIDIIDESEDEDISQKNTIATNMSSTWPSNGQNMHQTDVKLQQNANERNDGSSSVSFIFRPNSKTKSKASLSSLGPTNNTRSNNSKTSNSNSNSALKNDILNLNVPLADKIRPKTFDDYIGQSKAIGKQRLLHSLLNSSDNVPSMILWGPPGCGKTTLAKIIAHRCQQKQTAKFLSMSATSASVSDVKEAAKVAQNDYKMFKKRTILFLDEIHRFNKLQQDALLPHVENGTITFIGATTENPSFQVNGALLSRCRVITLDKLQIEDIKAIVKRACLKIGLKIKGKDGSGDRQNSSSELEDEDEDAFSLDPFMETSCSQILIEEEAVDALANLVDGDARAALNGLQLTVEARMAEENGSDNDRKSPLVVTLENVKEGLQRSHVLYDRNGEEHYNIVSALIKSMRGSDDNAALYWMTRMLVGGEDPLFVARRLVIFASEDVGLADPMALNQAVATFQACQCIGMPECGLNLAQCVVYLSRAPKSVESYMAYNAAKQLIENQQGPMPSVPLHLRNAPTKLLKSMGCGKGYKYPPAFEGKVVQDYLPLSLIGTDFFSKTKGQRPRDPDAMD